MTLHGLMLIRHYVCGSRLQEHNQLISGDILRAKAEELFAELGRTRRWSCSNGWISRWKTRHNIKYKAVSGENTSVDRTVCDDWRESTLKPVLQHYSANGVINADETGLYWQLLPDKTHAVKGETCTGGSRYKCMDDISSV